MEGKAIGGSEGRGDRDKQLTVDVYLSRRGSVCLALLPARCQWILIGHALAYPESSGGLEILDLALNERCHERLTGKERPHACSQLL